MIQCFELWKHRPYLEAIPDEREAGEGSDGIEIEEGSECDTSSEELFTGEVVDI